MIFEVVHSVQRRKMLTSAGTYKCISFYVFPNILLSELDRSKHVAFYCVYTTSLAGRCRFILYFNYVNKFAPGQNFVICLVSWWCRGGGGYMPRLATDVMVCLSSRKHIRVIARSTLCLR